ncbi:amylo-alpha-1,6-glucosidase [Archangium lipolyticum]|uniref:amylo-alpha-1,6-glucosidase n=1 Tax=Archangium lipolyticum TaxID=2970465 RepID=UPI002149C794|nr:glycoside hydrolase 100 family protein [Archangium lipolyticum]
MDDIAYARARKLLSDSVTGEGFLASLTPTTNYRRIWARDGIVCGLAGLLTGEARLAEALKRTLETLAAHQSPLGHIPSNVHEEAGTRRVSFGGLAGRVDTVPWFIIGVCQYAHFTGDRSFSQALLPALRKGLRLLQAWEFNERGLVYVPQSGDWADEYILHGYVLYDQVLRLWALRCFADHFQEPAVAEQAVRLTRLIQTNYWPVPEAPREEVYHPRAYSLALEGQGPGSYWLSSLAPGGYDTKFDLLANALCVLLRLGEAGQDARLAAHARRLAEPPTGLLPSFWPSILPGEEGWSALQANCRYGFRNAPGEFHNGGLWPVWNGWWGAALCALGERERARELLSAIHRLNQLDAEGSEWGFYENFHARTGQPLGTRVCTWSAAGAVLLHHFLEGKSLYFGEASSSPPGPRP